MGVLLAGSLAAITGPVRLAAPAAPGWLLASDIFLFLAAGSVLAAAVGPWAAEGKPFGDLAARAALGLAIAGLLAYGLGAQVALGAYAPGTPSMSHRLVAVLAIALASLDGGERRAPRLAAGLFAVLVLLAQAPLVAWLHPEGMVIYP